MYSTKDLKGVDCGGEAAVQALCPLVTETLVEGQSTAADDPGQDDTTPDAPQPSQPWGKVPRRSQM
jgi:hypothetical protein